MHLKTAATKLEVMSYKIVDEVIKRVSSREIGAMGKYCLIVLASHASDITRKCHPSVETIAYEMGCDRKTVIRAKKKLVDSGLIGIREVRGRGTVYTLRTDYAPMLQRDGWDDERPGGSDGDSDSDTAIPLPTEEKENGK